MLQKKNSILFSNFFFALYVVTNPFLVTSGIQYSFFVVLFVLFFSFLKEGKFPMKELLICKIIPYQMNPY